MVQSIRRGDNSRLAWVAILFLLSGAAGLIYEIVWERLLEIYFGVTMTSITLIVTAYMGGLGLGSLIGGQVTQRIKRVVLTYGLVEVAIAIFGFISPGLITWIGQHTAGSPYPLVFVISFGVLLIPTVLMGMTLPLLTQSFVNQVDTSGQVVGLLYGINTLGAGLGALIGGYILIGFLGFDGATQVAVFLNVVVGIGAIILLGNQAQVDSGEKRITAPNKKPALPYPGILSAAFLVGFINLGFEMLWFRVLGILNKNTSYGFPSILFLFLTGLAFGGFIWGRKADKSPDRIGLYVKLQLGSGILTALSFLTIWGMLHVPAFQPWISETFSNPQQPVSPFVWVENGHVFSRRLALSSLLLYFLPIGLLVLPASLLMGGGLPILDRIAITSAHVSGRRVGDIHLVNILGSVSGSMVISFICLPFLGTELTLKFLGLCSLLFIGLLRGNASPSRTSTIYFPASLLTLLFILPWRGEFYTKLYQTATGINALVYETGESVLVLGYEKDPASPSTLWIGGIQNSYFPTYGYYERTALTCASASQPKNILLIGLGGANTAYFITQLSGVEEITIVELMEDLGPFIKKYAPPAQRTLTDPRVLYIADDGRRFLYAQPDEKYDLIFIDPLYSFTSGHNNLYSREAMDLYRGHLSESGVFCAWFNENHVIPKTTATVFPYTDHFRDWIVAGNVPLAYDHDYIYHATATYVENSIGLYSTGFVDALDPVEILNDRIAGKAEIILNEAGTPILTDMNPWLEYYYFHAPID